MSILNLKDLHASVNGRAVLQGLDLCVGPGEVHAIVGPNGAGKSTLGSVLAGNPAFEAYAADATFLGERLLDLLPEERSRKGLFLAFQYPVELPGVNNTYLLRAALNAHRASRGEQELDAIEFMQLVRQKAKDVGLGEEFLSRNVNEGFSGGEKKRNEVLQMAVLEPKLAILDEVDSGLDMDALKEVAAAVNRLRSPSRSFIVITHYKRLLDLVRPDWVHVLRQGRIIRSGGVEILDEVDAAGFDSVGQGEDTSVESL